MKAKSIVFLIIASLTAIGFVLTNGFTYINGALSEEGSFLVRMICFTPITLAFCWMIVPALKRLSQKGDIVEFRKF